MPVVRSLITLAHDGTTRAHLGPHLPAFLVALGAIMRSMHSGKPLATEGLITEARAFVQWLLSVAPEMRPHLTEEMASECGV